MQKIVKCDFKKYFLSFNFEKRKFGLFFRNPIHYYREKQKFTTEHSIKTKTSQPAVISIRDLIGKIHSVADSIISQPFYKKKKIGRGRGVPVPNLSMYTCHCKSSYIVR